jgi:hypothetical protein
MWLSLLVTWGKSVVFSENGNWCPLPSSTPFHYLKHHMDLKFALVFVNPLLLATVKLKENFIVTIIFSKNLHWIRLHDTPFPGSPSSCTLMCLRSILTLKKSCIDIFLLQPSSQNTKLWIWKWRKQNGWLLSNRRYTLSNNFLLLSDMYIFQKFKIRSSVKRRTIFVIILLHR